MSSHAWLNQLVRDHRELVESFFSAHGDEVVSVGTALAEKLRDRRRLFSFGNGGSAADAQHLASELVGRFERERAPLPAIALTVDSSALTSIANDDGFEHVFAKQLHALAVAEDVVVAISTSGRSPNIVAGLQAARELGATTVGLLGRDGGPARALCDHALIVDSESTARIQEIHVVIVHALCAVIEAAVAGPA